jgi:hypothetical protein
MYMAVLWISEIFVRIRATDFRIRIWIWIMLFSSVAFKMQTKNKFYTLLFEGTFTSVLKEVTKQQKSRFPLLFLLDDGTIRMRTNNEGSGSGRPKNILIWYTVFIPNESYLTSSDLSLVVAHFHN